MEKIYVKVGDEVKAGDLLFEIDARIYQADLERAKGQLLASEDEFKRGAAQLETVSVTAYGDTGGVITAVFEAAKAFDDEGDNLLRANIADDSAHRTSIIWMRRLPPAQSSEHRAQGTGLKKMQVLRLRAARFAQTALA